MPGPPISLACYAELCSILCRQCAAGLTGLTPEVAERLSLADAAAAAAQKRAAEIRAEAALLVETVEDRAAEVGLGCGVTLGMGFLK